MDERLYNQEKNQSVEIGPPQKKKKKKKNWDNGLSRQGLQNSYK